MNNSISGTVTQQPSTKAIQRFSRKIGSTTYEVSLNFSNRSKENMKDKIVKLIKNEVTSK